jgi:hypothetical protein
MAVDKRLIPSEGLNIEQNPFEVELDAEEELDYEFAEETEAEDGDGVVIDFDPGADDEEVPFEANLAEHLEDGPLAALASDLVAAYKTDRISRAPWEKSYIKGLKLLGLDIEDRTQPWAGASGVHHPVLIEAVIKFCADAMMETFPAAGPVLSKVIGKETPEKTKQSKRVRHDMNYHCTDVMTEYRDEHEQALFHMAIGGSIFKKAYYDTQERRPTIPYVMADDFVVANGTTDLRRCPRATHVMKMWPNDLLKAQRAGEYRDVDVPAPAVVYSNVDEAEAKVAGEAPSAEKDDRHTILELHVEYDIEGFEDMDEEGEPTGIALPYIITIDESSLTVLNIYRNWKEEDPLRIKRKYFVQYKFLPGLGFYGMGLVHLIGGITKSATSILRQLVDAGTLANLPAGLKARGLRIKGDDSPLRPGEFRDVDIPGGAIKDNITFLPYKEPSAVLYQLLGNIVEEGRNIASIADLKISEMDNQAPVGTTLAIIERGMKVMSSVHARTHSAMRQEFKMLADLIRDYGQPEYEYETDEGATRVQDYDGRVDVIPVSNPNASTMAQRIMLGQATLQLAATAPHIYDLKLLHRGMLEAMNHPNAEKVIPLEDDMKPMDPVAENMAIMTGKPIKAHIHQEHEAHIKVHMAAAEDPKIQAIMAQSPAAKAIAAAGAAHIQEHVAFQYRREIEKQLGVPMPDYGEELPPEVESQLSKLVADAADKVLKKDLAEAQAQKNAAAEKDPVIQLQKAEIETKQAEVKRKGIADKIRGALGMEALASKERLHAKDQEFKGQKEVADNLHAMDKLRIEELRIQSQEKQTGARIGADVAMAMEDDEIEWERIESQERQNEDRVDQQDQAALLQAATQTTTKFMDLLRQRTNSAQNSNKDENNS